MAPIALVPALGPAFLAVEDIAGSEPLIALPSRGPPLLESGKSNSGKSELGRR